MINKNEAKVKNCVLCGTEGEFNHMELEALNHVIFFCPRCGKYQYDHDVYSRCNELPPESKVKLSARIFKDNIDSIQHKYPDLAIERIFELKHSAEPVSLEDIISQVSMN